MRKVISYKIFETIGIAIWVQGKTYHCKLSRNVFTDLASWIKVWTGSNRSESQQNHQCRGWLHGTDQLQEYQLVINNTPWYTLLILNSIRQGRFIVVRGLRKLARWLMIDPAQWVSRLPRVVAGPPGLKIELLFHFTRLLVFNIQSWFGIAAYEGTRK